MARLLLFVFLFLSCHAFPLQASLINNSSLVSTESDPDSFINHYYNAINGDYCETSTDLIISGPDSLILQRYYTNKFCGGGWHFLPQSFLVLGKDPGRKECIVNKDRFEWSYAFTGERSGGILTYSGWKRIGGDTRDPLKPDMEKECIGCVNTYSGEMNGQTNHQNNQLHCKGDTCEITLGDGTKRVYHKVDVISGELLRVELIKYLADHVLNSCYYRLISETLPSGNKILFSYNEQGRLSKIEMKNASETNIHSWIEFTYVFQGDGCQVSLLTSDEKTLDYTFEVIDGSYYLIHLQGSHCFPITYTYAKEGDKILLLKKSLPQGCFLSIEYDEHGRVKTLKEPEASTGQPKVKFKVH